MHYSDLHIVCPGVHRLNRNINPLLCDRVSQGGLNVDSGHVGGWRNWLHTCLQKYQRECEYTQYRGLPSENELFQKQIWRAS